MKLAIIGTGKIVHEALNALTAVESICVEAIYARPHSAKTGEELARQYGIKEVYTDYDRLLAEADVDAVYIGLINSAHFSYTKAALLAGKHVILEKPLTSTLEEAQELSRISKETGCYVLEAITNIHNRVFGQMKQMLGDLGQIRIAQFTFSQYSSKYADYLNGKIAPTFDPQLSGGALYDMNLYNIYLAVGLFGAPEDVAYYPNLGYNGVDISGIAVLSYPKFKAVCIGTKDTDGPNAAVIQGENGWMRMDGKPNVDNNLEAAVVGSTDGADSQRAMQAGEAQGQVRLSASGSVDRTFTRHYYEAEKVHHRMCAEFKDFARIIDRKEDSEAQDLLQKSLMVMEVLEKARKFAGIRFGCDG